MLINAGAVKNARLTSWPSLRADLSNAGAEWVDVPVVLRPICRARSGSQAPRFAFMPSSLAVRALCLRTRFCLLLHVDIRVK